MTEAMTVQESTIDRRKYVVFNRADLMKLLERTPGIDLTGFLSDIDKLELDDAVVIRRRDVFAASALYAYAHSIQTVIEISRSPEALDLEFLAELADFFAGEADHSTQHQVPD